MKINKTANMNTCSCTIVLFFFSIILLTKKKKTQFYGRLLLCGEGITMRVVVFYRPFVLDAIIFILINKKKKKVVGHTRVKPSQEYDEEFGLYYCKSCAGVPSIEYSS